MQQKTNKLEQAQKKQKNADKLKRNKVKHANEKKKNFLKNIFSLATR